MHGHHLFRVEIHNFNPFNDQIIASLMLFQVDQSNSAHWPGNNNYSLHSIMVYTQPGHKTL